jgi:Domain of unknown function (DUF4760)
MTNNFDVIQELESLRPNPLKTSDSGSVQAKWSYNSFIIGIIISILILIICSLICYKSIIGGWKFKIEIKDVVAIFTACIVTITCLYHAKNLKLNIENNQTKLNFDFEKFKFELAHKNNESDHKKKHEQKIVALNLSNKWASQEMSSTVNEARKFIKEHELIRDLKLTHSTDIIKMQKWVDEFNAAPERRATMLILNYFEHISVSIISQLADEEVIKLMFKTIMYKTYLDLKNYIDYIQLNAPEDKRSKTFYENYENLMKKWFPDQFKK